LGQPSAPLGQVTARAVTTSIPSVTMPRSARSLSTAAQCVAGIPVGAFMGAVVPDDGVVGEGVEVETVVGGACGWGVADVPGVQAPRSATNIRTIGPTARVTVPA